MRRRARALLLAVTVTARVLDTQRAVSLPVDSERQRLLDVTRECLALAIATMLPGNRLSDIGHAVQRQE